MATTTDRARRGRVAALLSGALLAATVGLGAPPPAAAQSTATACPPWDLPPTDFVDAGGVHEDGIRCAVWYGVASGRSDTRFDPAGQLTRGELATLLVRTLEAAGADLPHVADDERAFDDSATSAHGDALESLAAVGVIEGTGQRRVSPSGRLSRGQLATFLVGAVEHLEERELARGSDAFTDDDGSAHEAAIDTAANADLVAGVSATAYRHWDPLQRAQVATTLARLLDRFVRADRLERPATPMFRWEPTAIPAAVRSEMAGVSMRPGCEDIISYDDLRLVVLTHRGFDGRLHRGELVVHQDAVDDLRGPFATMYAEDFPLASVRRVDHYGGNDDRSMAANNTSAFNCRYVAGTNRWSEHSYGRAIDINPVHNPYISGSGRVSPPAGASYRDRSNVRPGMVVEGDAVVDAFDAVGWGWGGRWNNSKDYQHFSASGR